VNIWGKFGYYFEIHLITNIATKISEAPGRVKREK